MEQSATQSDEIIAKYSQMGFSVSAISKAWEVSDGSEASLLDYLCKINDSKDENLEEHKDLLSQVNNNDLGAQKNANKNQLANLNENINNKERENAINQPSSPGLKHMNNPDVEAQKKSMSPSKEPYYYGGGNKQSERNSYYQGHPSSPMRGPYNPYQSDYKQFSEAYEPLNPEQKLRKNGVSVGLQNVGNTCYVNSLLQTLFMSQKFVSEILNYDPNVTLVEDLTVSVFSKGDSGLKKRRIEASIELAKNLQKLFAMMIKSHKKYLNPTDVLKMVVDDSGQSILIGEQKDVTEYYLNFLSRIEEAFFYQEKFLKAKKEDVVVVNEVVNKAERTKSFVEKLFSRSKKIEIVEEDDNNDFSIVPLPEEPQEERLSMNPNTFLKKHFFGRMTEFRSYKMDETNVTQKMRDFVFGPIILDISNNNDLYEGIENYCFSTIDDFRAPNGKITKAKQELWIAQPPEFLVLQLNRVSYNLQDGFAYKVNKPFKFDKEIFLDRFMLEYKQEAEGVTQEINKLKEEVEKNEKKLQRLASFFGSKFGVLEVLNNAEGFLNSQVNPTPEQVEDVMLPNEDLGETLCSETETDTAMKVLRAYRKKVENQTQELTESIKKGKQEIAILINSMNKHKYHLASILIHDGNAGTGHYYSFNRNLLDSSWRRFNDIEVTQEHEFNVMREALGGYNNTSAYCLVYLSDKIVKQELETIKSAANLNISQNLEEFSVERNHYNVLVPQKLKEYVEADNKVFYKQIGEFKFNTYLSYIIRNYKVRYDSVEKAVNNTTFSNLGSRLDSFATFLKMEPNCERILKWYLLDTSFTEMGKSWTLQNIRDPEKLIKIHDMLSLLSKPYSFSNLVLTPQEKAQLDDKFAKYMELFPVTICYRFVIQSFLEKKWKEACYGVRRVLFMAKGNKNISEKPVIDVIQVVVLELALRAERYIKLNKLQKLTEVTEILQALVKGVLKPTDPHTIQVKTILNDALQEAEPYLKTDDFREMKQDIHKVTNAMHLITELEKPLKDFECQEFEKEVENALIKDLYCWKEIERNGPSVELAKTLSRFSRIFSRCTSFHYVLLKEKKPMTEEDRRESGYSYNQA